MKITYIHHSSFLVELDRCLLLFDYAGGTLPPMDPKKELFVFASHRHGDHFSPLVFHLADIHPKVLYLLSDDIWQNKIPQEHHGRVIFMDADTTLHVGTDITLVITTFHSTDEGVAFLIVGEETSIYHGGDLNHWKWNGETPAWNGTMEANYKKELAAITALSIRPEVAFLPLDGRLEEWFYLGLHEFMSAVNPKVVFPMHFWNDYSVISRLKALPISEPYREQVMDICQEGQTFLC